MTTRKSDGWVLVLPDGTICRATFAINRSDCWAKSFDFVMDNNFRRMYWKRWDASIAAAKKRGYIMQRARLELVTSKTGG